MAKYSPLAQGLGIFSIALGLSQLSTPRGLSKSIGLNDHEALMRTLGMREMSAGIGILSQPYPVGWMWGRVGGDAMDAGLLAAALANPRNDRARVAGALAAVLGIAVLDALCAVQMSRQPRASRERRQTGEGRIVKTISIDRTPEELYGFWRDYENLPRFMLYLDSVQRTAERRARWSYMGPSKMRMDLDVEITEETPNRAIAWRSSSGKMQMSGRVRFTDGPEGHGSIVRLEMQMRSKLLGKLPKPFAEIAGSLAAESLRRFKQLMETGEILSNSGQPSGRRAAQQTGRPSAQYGEISTDAEERIPQFSGRRNGDES